MVSSDSRNKSPSLLLAFLLLMPALAWNSLLQAEVRVADKHIFVMFPGVDAVWGEYLFLVSNSGTEPERFVFPVLLPKETIDFQGHDSLAPDELKLGADGGLTIDKIFQPGDQMISIGFKLPASQGQSQLTLNPNQDFASLGLFVWQNSLEVQSEGIPFEVRKNVSFSGRTYDTYTMLNGIKGQTYKATLTGIPEGRGRLWIIGAVLGVVLLCAGLGFAFSSRSKLPQGEEVI